MIFEADSIADGSLLEADVCIVGTGAAGIPLALSLAGKGLRILVLEAGHCGENADVQALYRGEVVDDRMHSPPDKYRHRRFGGSTAIWGGRCMPFDPIDFERRHYLPESGWPITYDDLAPFFPAANAFAEAGDFEYDADKVFHPEQQPLFQGFHSALVRTNSLERFSCPTNFARRYEKRLHLAQDIRLFLGANCTQINTRPDSDAITGLEIKTLSGKRFVAHARTYILATGGLETARLLLASRGIRGAGIGNENDLVGRYYMCHIAGNVGSLKVHGPTSHVRHDYELSPEGIYCRRRLCLTPEAQRQLGVANMVARLHFPRIADPSHRNGVLSGLFMARRFISYEYGKRLNDGSPPSLWLHARHLRNIVADPMDTTAFAFNWLRKRTLAERKFPSVILRNRTNLFSLEVHSEQTPNPDSRVTLTNDVDALGTPRIKIDWRYLPEDIVSVRKTLETFASEFARSGIASFTFDPATLEEDLTRFGAYGGHHIGTTRMGDNPATSVVDANCRVHSASNLYIASSSVFPTASQANPTLTITALALRLGRHLANQLTRPEALLH